MENLQDIWLRQWAEEIDVKPAIKQEPMDVKPVIIKQEPLSFDDTQSDNIRSIDLKSRSRRDFGRKAAEKIALALSASCNEDEQVKSTKKIYKSDLVVERVCKSAKVVTTVHNQCLFKCPDCKTLKRTWRTLRHHLKQTGHAGGSLHTEDLGKFIVAAVAHECKLCSAKVLCDAEFVMTHARKEHGMKSQREYYKILGGNGAKADDLKARIKKGENESAIIGNLCTFSCPKCSEKFKSINTLWIHLRKTKHIPMTKSVYACMNKLATYSCRICTDKVICDLTSLKSHCRNKHKISLEQYYEKTETSKEDDNTLFDKMSKDAPVSKVEKDLCEYNCTMCLMETKSWNTMRIHIREDHGLSQDRNVLKYLTKLTVFECQKCSKRMICDRVFTRVHKYGHEYQESADKKFREKHGYRKYQKEQRSLLHEKAMRFHAVRQEVPCVKPKSQPVLDRSDLDAKEKTRHVGNMCLFSCRYCRDRKFIGWGILNNHHHAEHGRKHYLYDQRAVVEARYHQCHLCSKVVLCDKYFLGNHCVSQHKINYSEYESIVRENQGEVLPRRISQELFDETLEEFKAQGRSQYEDIVTRNAGHGIALNSQEGATRVTPCSVRLVKIKLSDV